MAESVIELYKTECVRHEGAFCGVDELELASLFWCTWPAPHASSKSRLTPAPVPRQSRRPCPVDPVDLWRNPRRLASPNFLPGSEPFNRLRRWAGSPTVQKPLHELPSPRRYLSECPSRQGRLVPPPSKHCAGSLTQRSTALT